MVQQYRQPSCMETRVKLCQTCCFWMWLPCLWVLRLLEVLWQHSSNATQQSQQRKVKSSQHMQTTNLLFWSKCMKVNVVWPKTIIHSESLSSLAFLLLLVVFHKLRSHLMLMPMELWMFLRWTKALEKKTRLSSQMTKVDCPKKT